MSGGMAWISALMAGAIAGLIPFFVARARGNSRLACGAVAACLVAGVLGGALIAAPLSIVLTVVAARQSGPTDPPDPVSYWAVAIPAALLLWFVGMGLVASSLDPKYISAQITIPLTLVAMVFGGYLASAITWLANRTVRDSESSDLASRISSIGAKDDSLSKDRES